MARTKKLNLAKTVTTESPIFAGIATTSITGNAATVTTNANLTGDVTSVGNATTLTNTTVTASGYQSPYIQVDAKGRLTKALDEPCSDEIHFSGGAALNAGILTATGVTEWDTTIVSAVPRTGIFTGIATGTATTIAMPFSFDETVTQNNFVAITGGGFTHRFNLTKSELVSRSSSEIICRWTGSVNTTTGAALPERPAIAIFRYVSNTTFTLTLKVQKEFLYTGTSPVVVTGRVISLAATLPNSYAFTSTTRPTSAATTASLGAAGIQSLITKADGDFRYRAFSSIAAAPTTRFASTSPATVHTLASVPIGKYLIEVYAVSIHGAGGGVYTLNFGTTSVNFGLFHSYNAPNFFTPIQSIQTSPVASTLSFLSTSAATMLLRVTGTFEITAGSGVNVLLQYNQASAVTSTSTSQAQSYLVATKLS
jgi:hypothetical protein